MDKTLLTTLLAVPTVSLCEQYMIAFLKSQLENMGIPHTIDQHGNIYATKGTGPGFYPMVCAHTDTVHGITGHIVVREGAHGTILRAFTPDGLPTGCGGDDKAGIFVCLELLKLVPRLKVAFWATEEIGCVGSSYADPSFCSDAGYCIEFDSPNGDIISYSCDRITLFNHEGPFAKSVIPILDAHGMNKWQWHPYTDVAQLRRKFNFECLNLPCGYHRMHTEHEYVVLSEVENAINVGLEIIGKAEHRQYFLERRWHPLTRPSRAVTGLILS